MTKDEKKNLTGGIVVAGGIALFIAMLFWLGLSDLFVEKGYLTTSFNESVKGIQVGSQVTYCGVQIGTVKRVSVQPAAKIVLVDMDIDLGKLIPKEGENKFEKDDFDLYVIKAIKEGMRCRIEYAGVTGGRYIDFDYFAEKDQPVPPIPQGIKINSGNVYVPSVPSTMHDIFNSIEIALDRISKIDFDGISSSTVTALNQLNRMLDSPEMHNLQKELSDTIENLKRISLAVSNVVDEKRLVRIMDDLNANMSSLHQLSDSIREEIANAKIGESTGALRESSYAFINMQEEALNSLAKINRLADNLNEVVEILKDQPDALIRGRALPGD